METVQLLLDNGAQINTKTATGATALFAAASRGHCQVVNLLLEKGADPMIRDSQDKTAYMYAKDYNVKSVLTSWTKK